MTITLHALKAVWGGKKGYVFIPRRNPKKLVKGKPLWDEGRAFSFPDEWEAIKVRVIKSVEEGFDVYFCPLVFSSPHRHKENVLSTANILWADLDEVNPASLKDLRPSIAWASSNDRYQAIWLLDGNYDIKEIETINRDVTYTIGADKGGWDITQVLRVPGTPNYKYNPPHEGKYLWGEKRFYSLDTIKSLITPVKSEPSESVVTESFEELLKGYDVSKRVWELLNTKEEEVEVGERSDRLWELETLLVEAGVPILTVVKIVKKSVWNKFRGRRDEDKRIYTEVLKAEVHVKDRLIKAKDAGLDPKAEGFEKTNWAIPFSTFAITKLPPPEWLVEGIWQANTYGMLAGEPKTFKSVLATDLALSIASGKPFLNTFNVHKRGTVLMIQEENNPQTVQDRIFKIGNQKKILVAREDKYFGIPEDLPMFFCNNYGVDLTDSSCRILIEQTIKQTEPILLILDPFYMMLGKANENDASEMRNTLQWLTMLRNKYGVSIMVLHHYNKSNNSLSRGGQKIRGTSEFHAWVESALYVKTTNKPGEIKVEREFRSFPLLTELKISIDIGEPGELYYVPEVQNADDDRTDDLKKEEILTLLSSMPRTFDEIKTLTKITRAEARKWLKELRDDGLIDYDGGGGRGKTRKYYLTSGGAKVVKEDEDMEI